jgi:hypothetical protein
MRDDEVVALGNAEPLHNRHVVLIAVEREQLAAIAADRTGWVSTGPASASHSAAGVS